MSKINNLSELEKNSNRSEISVPEIFENPEFGKVRTAIDEEGNPLFCGFDVASILGYKDPRSAVSKHCKSGTLLKWQHASNSGSTNITFITESDVYRLIMRSKLPSAEKFQDWVCGDVLPSLRKKGYYSMAINGTPSACISNTRERVMRWLEEHEALELAVAENEKLEKENKSLKPKGDVYDRFINTNYMTGIREFSKQLNIPENELISYLIGGGYLYREMRSRKKDLKIRSAKNFTWFRYCDAIENDKPGRKIMITPRGKAEIYSMMVKEGIINPDNINI